MGIQKATLIQRLRLVMYKFALIFIILLSGLCLYVFIALNLLDTIIINAGILSATGAAIAAFLFTIQSILLTIPSKNAYLQIIRKQSDYLLIIHRFCRYSEIIFLVILIPMFLMNKEYVVFNGIIFTLYLCALFFTIWSMYLMGSILIKCERHANDKNTEIETCDN